MLHRQESQCRTSRLYVCVVFPLGTYDHLPDILRSSKSGALAKSAWNTRGWTVLRIPGSQSHSFLSTRSSPLWLCRSWRIQRCTSPFRLYLGMISSASSYQQFMVSRRKSLSGGRCRRPWLSQVILLPWTGSASYPTSIATCQLAPLHMKLRYSCHIIVRWGDTETDLLAAAFRGRKLGFDIMQHARVPEHCLFHALPAPSTSPCISCHRASVGYWWATDILIFCKLKCSLAGGYKIPQYLFISAAHLMRVPGPG